jgi:hypothetical protein
MIFVRYWRCPLIKVSVIIGSTVSYYTWNTRTKDSSVYDHVEMLTDSKTYFGFTSYQCFEWVPCPFLLLPKSIEFVTLSFFFICTHLFSVYCFMFFINLCLDLRLFPSLFAASVSSTHNCCCISVSPFYGYWFSFFPLVILSIYPHQMFLSTSCT